MIIILYRWKTKEGMEDQLIRYWSEVTEYILKNCDSLGSRLHRGDDGFWYAYAQWKSLEQREAAFATLPEMESRRQMRAAIEEFLPEIILTPVADFLI